MKKLIPLAASLAALGLAAALPVSAQTTTTTTTTSGSSWRMPYQSGFWGNAGLSIGRGELDGSCPGGFSCDQKDNVYRLHAGGRFNNAIGGEIGLINLGDYQRGGGTTDGWGVDLALVAGIPIGANSSVFGKLGALYARTEVDGPAAGLSTGKERGWGPRFGIGGQVGLTPQWALRADWDRYRVALPGSKEDLDTLTIGAQYTFR